VLLKYFLNWTHVLGQPGPVRLALDFQTHDALQKVSYAYNDKSVHARRHHVCYASNNTAEQLAWPAMAAEAPHVYTTSGSLLHCHVFMHVTQLLYKSALIPHVSTPSI
jgi:hypothetical protein